MRSRRIVRAKRLFEGRRALAAIAGTGTLFLGLAALIRYSFLDRLDLSVTEEIQERHLPSLRPVMIGLTYTAEPVVVPILGVVSAAGLWRAGLPRAAALVIFSTVSIPTNILLKTFWDRARPDKEIVNVMVETAGTSFPSGHAMGATAFYGALAALVWIHTDRRKIRRPLTVLLILLPIGAGISRIYLGAHWLSDVVAGTALGLVILIPLVRRYLQAIPADVEDQAKTKDQPGLRPQPLRALPIR